MSPPSAPALRRRAQGAGSRRGGEATHLGSPHLRRGAPVSAREEALRAFRDASPLVLAGELLGLLSLCGLIAAALVFGPLIFGGALVFGPLIFGGAP